MTDELLEAVRGALDAARGSWSESGEAKLDTGLEYATGEPARVETLLGEMELTASPETLAAVVAEVRKTHLGFRAVRLAGRPEGWLAAAERVVAREGMNVNRAGVVFVPAVEGSCRDLALLALRLGESSHAVFAELIDLAPE